MLEPDIQNKIDILADFNLLNLDIFNYVQDSNKDIAELKDTSERLKKLKGIKQKVEIVRLRQRITEIREKITEHAEKIAGSISSTQNLHADIRVIVDYLRKYTEGLPEGKERNNLNVIVSMNEIKLANLTQQINLAEQQIQILKDVRTYHMYHLADSVNTETKQNEQAFSLSALLNDVQGECTLMQQKLAALTKVSKVMFAVLFGCIMVQIVGFESTFSLGVDTAKRISSDYAFFLVICGIFTHTIMLYKQFNEVLNAEKEASHNPSESDPMSVFVNRYNNYANPYQQKNIYLLGCIAVMTVILQFSLLGFMIHLKSIVGDIPYGTGHSISIAFDISSNTIGSGLGILTFATVTLACSAIHFLQRRLTVYENLAIELTNLEK